MHDWTARLALLLMLSGCNALADERTRGAPLAELHGTLSLATGVKPPKHELRVSVIWQDPGVTRDVPSSCENAKLAGWRIETNLLEQRATLTTDFPSGFSVKLTEPPPPAAVVDDVEGSGVSAAWGDLVVYEDRNGNDRLDPSGFDDESPDLVFGWSRGTNPLDLHERKSTVVYLSDDYEPANGTLTVGDGKAGYSLETFEGYEVLKVNSKAERLSEATIDLTLDPTAYAQQSACALRCDVSPPIDTECDAPNDLLNGDLGDELSLNVGEGSRAWMRRESDKTVYTAATCYVEHPGSTNVYTFDFGTRTAQGCTLKGFACVFTKPADSPEGAGWPCPQYREGKPGPESSAGPPPEPPSQ